MESQIFQIPGMIIEANIKRNNTIKLKIESQENTSPEAMKRMCELIEKTGWFTFNVHQIEASDIIDLPPLKPTDTIKTPAQVQRAIIYRMWEQDHEGYKDSESHYRYYMEKIANWLKEKLV